MMKKTLTALFAGVAVTAIGLAAGCNQTQHNWSDKWYSGDAEYHWHECLDDGCNEVSDKAKHVDSDNNGVCDVCERVLTSETPTDEEVTLYFRNSAEWETVYAYTYNDANEQLLGEYPGTQTTAVSGKDGWVQIKVQANPATDGFNVIFNDGGDDNQVNKVIDDATNVYVTSTGKYSSFDAAEADKPAEKNEYTVYLYAPDAAEAVTVSVWGNMDGAFDNNSSMTADTENDGWYSFTFKTEKDIADGLNLNFYDGETTLCSGYTTDADWVYFIGNKSDIKYPTMEEAEQAYDEFASPQVPEDMEEYTLYVYAPDWGESVKIHTWTAYETGAWGSASMTAVDGKDGWYSYTFECSQAAFEGKGVNVIFFNGDNDSQRLETYTNNSSTAYYNAAAGDSTGYTSMEAAENAESNYEEFTLYVYAPDWGENVKIHIWDGNNIGVTGDWGTASMTAVDGEDGWFEYTFDFIAADYESAGLNVIFFNGDNGDDDRIQIFTKDSTKPYYNAESGDTDGYSSMDEALAE